MKFSGTHLLLSTPAAWVKSLLAKRMVCKRGQSCGAHAGSSCKRFDERSKTSTTQNMTLALRALYLLVKMTSNHLRNARHQIGGRQTDSLATPTVRGKSQARAKVAKTAPTAFRMSQGMRAKKPRPEQRACRCGAGACVGVRTYGIARAERPFLAGA